MKGDHGYIIIMRGSILKAEAQAIVNAAECARLELFGA